MPGSRKRSSYKGSAFSAKGKSRKRGRYGAGGGRGARIRALNPRTGGFRGIENKYVDYEGPQLILQQTLANALVTPGPHNALNAIAQGDGENQRDGRKCTLTSIYLIGDIEQLSLGDAEVTLTGHAVRVALVWDKQCNGAALNPADVFQEVTSAGVAPYSFRNLQYTSRFQVLHDETFMMNPTAGAGAQKYSGGVPVTGVTSDWVGDKKTFKIYKKLNIPVLFDNSTPVISSITNNSLQLIAWCETNAGDIGLSYNCRVRFVG